ncbi:MAG: peptide chain release factor 1 [Bacilli bacterium]|nr:peptide chain release factor 1 [Bacilli bacterium]
MKDRLEVINQRYEQISKDLLDINIVSDIKKMTALSKEQRSLEKTVEKYHALLACEKNISELKELVHDSDPDIREMAEMELSEAQELLSTLTDEIKILLIPKDPNDEKNVVMEIRGAAGGDEANIFAGDLYRMYIKYAETKGWKVEIMDSEVCEAGGFSQISLMISGDSVYSYLKYESGSHRVQRVPATESQGRIHTSTATVLVMPEAEDLEVELDMNDVRIDIFCSSGPGGQSVNTTKSAVRVTHMPTGIVVSCQDGKSQHENKANALKVLKTRLYDFMLQQKEEAEGAERLSKIGRGDRSEKIRTYNYPQNRVTDHRIGFTVQQLDRIMEGRIDSVIDALIEFEQKRALSVSEE